MGASDTELVVRIADSLEEDEGLAQSMKELRLIPRFVRSAVRARFVHQLCESPPLSELAAAVEQARARCEERIKQQSLEPGATIVYPLEWDMTIEVDGEAVGRAQIHLDIEFDALDLWHSLGTAHRASGKDDVPAELNLSVTVGDLSSSGSSPSLQFGPWSYPSRGGERS